MSGPDRITDANDPAFAALFDDIKRSWFRLETLQVYTVEHERADFEQFLTQGRLDRRIEAWQQMVSRHAQAGRRLDRVHVVIEPLTDYLQYELAAYQQNREAGEDIKLIPVTPSTWPIDLPRDADFWLFDDTEVWDMHYDSEGRFLAAVQSKSDSHLADCRRWRDRALNLAVPLADYLVRAV